MKKYLIFAVAAILSGSSAMAQSFDEFKQLRKSQLSEFEEQRAKEFEEFKARYYAAFEEFRRSYRRMLEDEEKAVDLMASDDGIRVEPIKMAPAPVAVVSTVAEQKRILRENIRSIAVMTPDELVPVLSEAEDTVARMQEAAQVMEAIVANMNTDAQEDEDPIVPVSTSVVLEPYDAEYFNTLPDAETAGRVQEEIRTPVEQEETVSSDAAGTSGADAAGAAVSTAVPSGKPTEYVRISSPFGSRIHPITHKRHGHKGIDLAAPRNTPIYATADGQVTFSGRNGGYGNFVKLNHRNGYKTAYAHMNRIAVRKGKSVKKGDLIGYVGSTGASTGNHLHYEVYYQDKLIDPATTL